MDNIKYLDRKLKIIIRFILVFTQKNIYHFVDLKCLGTNVIYFRFQYIRYINIIRIEMEF